MELKPGGPYRETAKQRAQRVPLGYLRRVAPLDRWRSLLTGLALAVGAGWLLLAVAGVPSPRVYSHGPVSQAHAKWEQQCEACHAPFHPVRDGTVASWLGATSEATDRSCRACHQGPPHHASEDPASVVSCGTCHREHQGRESSLVALVDRHCISCHADLEGHMLPEFEPRFHNRVTAFHRPDGHPEFRPVEGEDPGRLRFTHAQHMLAGLPKVPGEEGWFTLGRIDERDRARYALPGQTDGDLVQLDCRSCHELDRSSLPTGEATGLQDARYFAPVQYEQHCRGCHPLEFDSPAAFDVAVELDPPQETVAIAPRTVPHGLQIDALQTWLQRNFLADFAAGDTQFLAQRLEPAQIHPGKHLPDAAPVAAAEAVERQTRQALALLLEGRRACGECHYFDQDGEQFALATPVQLESDPASVRIVSPDVPQVWFAHARFNHAPHRAVSCRECHHEAYPDSHEAARRWDGATEASRVMLPGIETCRRCHAPAKRDRLSGDVHGGARFDCTECHRYHHGDEPGHGLGSPVRDAAFKRPIDDLLRAAPPLPLEEGTLP